MKSKKLLLSGATSLLGRKFVDLFGLKYSIISFSKHDLNNPIDLLDLQHIEELAQKVNPDVIVHLAATSDRSDTNINETNIVGTKNILEIAKVNKCSIVFMSSESVYGGNQEKEEEILETRSYNPKSDYAKSKVKSEELIIDSGLPYLILRGHRFIGIVNNYNKLKQFPDTLRAILRNEEVHLDSRKIFRPSFINHISEIIDFYIANDLSEQRILNSVIAKNISYYELIKDICCHLGLNQELIINDGKETAWELRSILSVSQLKKLNYPQYSYNKMLEQLKVDFKQFKIQVNND